jgi:hypothetical protein
MIAIQIKKKKKIKIEGTRFTVLHAGCLNGFLAGCSFLLNSKNNDRLSSYHEG